MFQKIAYFATQSGIPTRLSFSRGSFGPFSDELKGVLGRLANHRLIQEERLGRMFAVRPGPTFHDAEQAFGQQLDAWQEASERVADLFLRLDTQQSEVVATVHFAAAELQRRDGMPSESSVLDAVMAWKLRRRPPLETAQVATAVRHLAMLGWLDVKASPDLPISEDSLVEA